MIDDKALRVIAERHWEAHKALHANDSDGGKCYKTDHDKEMFIGAWLEGQRFIYDEYESARTQQQPGWQPIETAPKGKILILWANTSTPDMDNWKMATGCQGFDSVWDWDGQRLDKEYQVKPTHWMPLPTPPNTDAEGE